MYICVYVCMYLCKYLCTFQVPNFYVRLVNFKYVSVNVCGTTLNYIHTYVLTYTQKTIRMKLKKIP